MTRLLTVIVTLSLAACGGSSTKTDLATGTSPDMTASTAADMYSACGHPGDTGNSKQVGMYCGSGGETACAANTFANICSSLGNTTSDPSQNSYFCTATCTSTSPSDYCGENATCVCQTAGCGCIPNACVPPDAGT